MLDFLKGLLGLKRKEKHMKEPLREVREHDYILEIRPILEKYKLKSLLKN